MRHEGGWCANASSFFTKKSPGRGSNPEGGLHQADEKPVASADRPIRITPKPPLRKDKESPTHSKSPEWFSLSLQQEAGVCGSFKGPPMHRSSLLFFFALLSGSTPLFTWNNVCFPFFVSSNNCKTKKKRRTLGGTRTRNPQIRSLVLYPLSHEGDR